MSTDVGLRGAVSTAAAANPKRVREEEEEADQLHKRVRLDENSSTESEQQQQVVGVLTYAIMHAIPIRSAVNVLHTYVVGIIFDIYAVIVC